MSVHHPLQIFYLKDGKLEMYALLIRNNYQHTLEVDLIKNEICYFTAKLP